ncbi:hypothetical protein CBR_g5646 [Chara braunii]|uniref:Uncharacterized protein n=1 Tax=Chara braunii TaxID=69332 RepID=A0A388JRZ1_CHABU|nr:hypothetical protein CBR_g5646 [Chara braunii]|eukprot:GBG60472.1 hypothetical protein CBR_g5646 [Chara braunii]
MQRGEEKRVTRGVGESTIERGADSQGEGIRRISRTSAVRVRSAASDEKEEQAEDEKVEEVRSEDEEEEEEDPRRRIRGGGGGGGGGETGGEEEYKEGDEKRTRDKEKATARSEGKAGGP